MLSTIAGLIETVTGKGIAVREAPADRDAGRAPVRVAVVGAGGAGGNAVARMIDAGVRGVRMLALNTDVQALSRLKRAHTFAIGPNTTGGMGSGGRPEIGRKAIKESQSQVAELLDGSDLVFVTSGMGGGTGTGAAPVVADIARRAGALTVGVVTMPFSFEGPERRAAAIEGIGQLRAKVDTLIAVENDRLLGAVDGDVRLDRAFALADEVLRQGVQGISDLVTAPGLMNVDFADLKALMRNGGPSYMALGEGRGRSAACDAALAALSNPLFDAPLERRPRHTPERDRRPGPHAGAGPRDGRARAQGQRHGRRRAARSRPGRKDEAPRQDHAGGYRPSAGLERGGVAWRRPRCGRPRRPAADRDGRQSQRQRPRLVGPSGAEQPLNPGDGVLSGSPGGLHHRRIPYIIRLPTRAGHR